jgi:hypothetical protein
MTCRQHRQPTQAAVIEEPRPFHGADRPRQLKGWRTVRELTEELRFPSEDACRTWLRRNHIPNVRRGRFILVDGLDIDRTLRKAS